MSKKARELKDFEIEYIKANYEHNTTESVRMGLFRLNKERGLEFTLSNASLRNKAENLGLTKKISKKVNPNFSSGGSGSWVLKPKK